MSRICVGFLVVVAGAIFVPCSNVSLAQEKPSPSPVWEYKVLTKLDILDLGQKDLAAGLNHLGREGWELTAVDGDYIFKRSPLTVPQLQDRLERAKGNVEQWQDRTSWSERMFRKGFVSQVQLDADRTRLRSAKITLDNVKTELSKAPKDSAK